MMLLLMPLLMLILYLLLVNIRKFSKLIVYLLSFFIFVLYNYYGDNMNSSNVIVKINTKKDIDKIDNNTKYINISIDSLDNEGLDYFLLNGSSFSYSDTINNRNGFIYASYDMFKKGENIIETIIYSMPSNLSDIEKVRYIYIYLGKILNVDINTFDNKNDSVSFDRISTINNIWGALSKCKVNDMVASKIFMYICFRIGIKCELISSSIKGNIANKVFVGDNFLVVDLFNDIYNIQGGFCTKFFDKYNDDKDMDRKIGYIKDEYLNYYIDTSIKNISISNDNVLKDILSTTSNILNINNIGSYELFKLYRDIFDKYVPGYDIKINNLFVCSDGINKDHFIVFNYGDTYYSYNYNKKCFISIDYNVLLDNINNKRIGIYEEEDFELKVGKVIL